MSRFNIGDKVVLSKTVIKEESGEEWFDDVLKIMNKKKFFIVKGTEVFVRRTRFYVLEGIGYLFSGDWLEPYKE